MKITTYILMNNFKLWLKEILKEKWETVPKATHSEFWKFSWWNIQKEFSKFTKFGFQKITF